LQLDERVQMAHGDAWQVQGRLREPHGGGALELRDIRLMASGLPHPQWNNGDVTGPNPDLDAARGFYADRAVPWGVRVPVGIAWRGGGRWLFRKRLMGLTPERFRPAGPVDGLTVRSAGPDDLDAVLRVDATAFEEDPATERQWIEPHLHSPPVTVALAEHAGEPVATAYALRSDGVAGPALYVAGVAVLPSARRRGIAAAVSAHLLTAGFEAGARLAHLHPDTDEAARVYERLGFVEVAGFDVYIGL
jgi:ribosomal protein S18 acetylase RimI-like enzyme